MNLDSYSVNKNDDRVFGEKYWFFYPDGKYGPFDTEGEAWKYGVAKYLREFEPKKSFDWTFGFKGDFNLISKLWSTETGKVIGARITLVLLVGFLVVCGVVSLVWSIGTSLGDPDFKDGGLPGSHIVSFILILFMGLRCFSSGLLARVARAGEWD